VRIAVASSKGGTGKTTVALHMASVADGPVQLLDCDVEEPNCHLFLAPIFREKRAVTIQVPEIHEGRCTYCGKCSAACRFNAIAVLLKNAMVFPELCHGCDGCRLACPESAITMKERAVGFVEKGRAGSIEFVQGKLDVGVALSPPLIKAVKKEATPEGLVIIDAPPGASCPMVAAVNGADYCILVTEPTPFGLHDLGIAVETVRKIGVPAGVVINRAGGSYRDLHDYLRREEVEILMELPFSRDYAGTYSRGEILVSVHEELKGLFKDLLRKVRERAAGSMTVVAEKPAGGAQ